MACVKIFQYGEHTVSIETGLVAKQATGSVMVNMEGTMVLGTVVGVQDDKVEARDYFPLTVDYSERMYAAGIIPGGFFKREGRPTEKETLIARLVDRPIRPLFPQGFMNEVQIILTVMSLNPQINPDIPAMIAASAALAVSGIPFHGPIGAARVGYHEGKFILNPTQKQLAQSQLDLVVAGTNSSVLMVESEAQQLSEEIMLDAVKFGHKEMQIVIKAINLLAKEAGKPQWEWQALPTHDELVAKIDGIAKHDVTAAYAIADKMQRQQKLKALRKSIVQQLTTDEKAYTEGQVSQVFSELEEKIVRGRLLNGELRIDGRDTETVRPITIQTGILPRTHGSACFTRGETQAIGIATIGTGRDAQVIDSIMGQRKENFMLHYNFPPYCVGEVGRFGSPKRREIGHGNLAQRAVKAVLPSTEKFPYVLRVVSEITESNGSSSMATVCAAIAALKTAGVPITDLVAGIAMGLIKEGDKYAVLTDILGDEDHLGDMDFKVAGTKNGVTALQMDIKINGITPEIMEQALTQARAGRLHILEIMEEALAGTGSQLSEFAPRMYMLKVHPDKIRDIIGKGGITIRALTEETGTNIEINDDGTVVIIAPNKEAGEDVKYRIEMLTADVEVNKVYAGKIVRIVDFGAFVNILPGRDGLLHISQISHERVNDVNDVLSMGQVIDVKVLEVDRQGKIRLSVKELLPPPVNQPAAEPVAQQDE